MSLASVEREIAREAVEFFNNPKIRVKDIMEWSSGEIKPHDGEVAERLPKMRLFVAIKKEMDKRPPIAERSEVVQSLITSEPGSKTEAQGMDSKPGANGEPSVPAKKDAEAGERLCQDGESVASGNAATDSIRKKQGESESGSEDRFGSDSVGWRSKRIRKEKIAEGRKLLADFEQMTVMAKARAFSKVSLERPLTDAEHAEFMKLGEQLGIKV